MTPAQSNESNSKHVIFFVAHFFGHARALSTLAARIVQMRDVVVTFLVVRGLYDRVKVEVSRSFGAEETHLRDKIRVIALEDGNAYHETSGAPGAFKAAWTCICNDEPLICAETNTQFEAPPVRPTAALIDFFAADAFDVVRESKDAGLSLKLYMWYACAANTFFPLMAVDPIELKREEAERTGKSVVDVACDWLWSNNGRLMTSPHSPTVYDYESQPQQFSTDRLLLTQVMIRVPRLMREVDGIVTFDAVDYQPMVTAPMREWFAERSRNVFFAGPLIPTGDGAMEIEKGLSPNASELVAFLDNQLNTRGKCSVLYWSFGSVFWPRDGAKVWAVLDVLMEKGIPIVFSRGASLARRFPPDVKAKVAAYKDMIVSEWVPQQTVINHPAIGWSLMHGGHNGVLESILAGVPMILWPIAVDQPFNSIYLAEEVNVAYELVEVRLGKALGPIYRNGRKPVGTIDAVKEEARAILDKAFGADGAEKRERLQTLRKTLQAAWDEDGVARREVAAFLDDF